MSATPLHADNSAQAEYWNCVAGQKWTDHQQHQDQVLSPVSDRLIAAARPKPGERVIDVGCGCGATTIDFAARVSPGGEVLGLDISEPMLARARERRGRPADPVRTGRRHRLRLRARKRPTSWRPGSASCSSPTPRDPSPTCASGLKVAGRLAFACWREARQNPFFILALREAGKHAPPLPETDPEAPGPFAFASEVRVRRILSQAGYADIMLTPHNLELDIAVGRGLDTAVRAAMTIGPTSRMLEGQSEAVRSAVEADIRKALAAHARGDSVPLGAAIWIVTATNPG